MPGNMDEPGAGKPAAGEKIIEMEVERLREFNNHPFRIRNDPEMKELVKSIDRYGILTPLIVRPVPDGCYEIISGHRRTHAAKLLGYRKVPVIIRPLTDDQAVIAMVDSNLQRETLLHSEKALAIRMKYDVIKRDLERQNASYLLYRERGLRSVQVLGKMTGGSPRQVQRYLKISELIPELLERLDQEEIAFNPAYEAAFLKPEEQRMLLEAMDYTQSSPSLSQAQRIKQLSRNNELTVERVKEILQEVKKGDIRRVTFKNEQLYQYFPRGYTAEQMKKEILEMLEKRRQAEGLTDSGDDKEEQGFQT